MPTPSLSCLLSVGGLLDVRGGNTSHSLLVVHCGWLEGRGGRPSTRSVHGDTTLKSYCRAGVLLAFTGGEGINYHLILVSYLLGLELGCTGAPSVSVLLLVVQPELSFTH